MAKVGRKLKLTPEKVDVITTVVRQGGFLYEAARAAEVQSR